MQISRDYGYQAFRILQSVFILALVLQGLSEIFQVGSEAYESYILSVDWIKKHERFFTISLGALEILLGVGLVFKPWIFAYVLSFCLFIPLANFLLTGNQFTLFMGCFCLMLSAFALGKLSQKYMPS